jgi:hypothetical protein
MKAPLPDALHIDAAAPGEEERIRPLFREVFKVDIGPEMVHWKYGEGRGQSWGAWDADGDLLVHCGVFYRRALAGGHVRRIAQLGDLMASPRKPGGLPREPPPIARLIRRVLSELPDEHNPDALAFGFPSERAMRLGERLGVFAQIDQVHALTFDPLPPCAHGDRIDTLHQLGPQAARRLDRLWTAMAADLQDDLVGVRDAQYLRWRYFEHPENHYTCLVVRSRWLRRTLGVMFVKDSDTERELMDIVAPLHLIPRLLTAARRWLGATAGTRLTLWLASTHAERFAPLAQHARPLEFRIMANPLGPAWVLERFDRRWWLTSGDTDYR